MTVAVAKVAQASRKSRNQQPGALYFARAELVAARLERAIGEALDPEPPNPPIRHEDRVRLARMLEE